MEVHDPMWNVEIIWYDNFFSVSNWCLIPNMIEIVPQFIQEKFSDEIIYENLYFLEYVYNTCTVKMPHISISGD